MSNILKFTSGGKGFLKTNEYEYSGMTRKNDGGNISKITETSVAFKKQNKKSPDFSGL
jgi:hypothetical protein